MASGNLSGAADDRDARLARALDSLPPPAADEGLADDHRQAAVAIVLAGVGSETSALLMVRSERAGDRWSGQVSLPGGHAEPVDADLIATARRESHEETGLDPGIDGRLIGALPARRARARGAPIGMTVTPYVFTLNDRPPVAPGPEATEVFWLPLAEAASGKIDDVHRLQDRDVVWKHPCWRYEGRMIWGMTFRMLRELLDASDGLFR